MVGYDNFIIDTELVGPTIKSTVLVVVTWFPCPSKYVTVNGAWIVCPATFCGINA